MKTLVIGDSFTYGSGLINPAKKVWWRHAWPDADCIAEPGQSNDWILRQLRYNAHKYDHIVVMWTFPHRFEFKFNMDTKHGRNNWLTCGVWEEDTEISKYTDTFNKYVGTNKEYQLYNSWRNIEHATLMMKYYEKKYTFTHADWSLFEGIKNMPLSHWYFPDIYGDNKGFLNWAIDGGYKIAECGHPKDQAHVDFGHRVKEWLG